MITKFSKNKFIKSNNEYYNLENHILKIHIMNMNLPETLRRAAKIKTFILGFSCN